MTPQEFSEAVERVFRRRHGKRGYVNEAQKALQISKAQFHRYANGTSPVPDAISERLLALLRQAAIPLPPASEVLRLAASSVVGLYESQERFGHMAHHKEWNAYPDAHIRLMNVFAAANALSERTTVEKQPLPADLEEWITVAGMPCETWLRHFPEADQMTGRLSDVLLLDDDGLPTTDAYDMASRNMLDAMEEGAFLKVMEFCRNAGSNGDRIYAAIRRFIILKPFVENVIDEIEKDRVLGLVPNVGELMLSLYTEMRISRTGRTDVPICTMCRWILAKMPNGTGYVGEYKDPKAVLKARTGEHATIRVHSFAHGLIYPLRLFWLYPGILEVSLDEELTNLGYKVTLWPKFDAVDLLIEGQALSRPIAVDVKDYQSAQRLAHSFDPGKAHTLFPGCRMVVVIPAHRDTPAYPFRRIFRQVRNNAGLPPVEIMTDAELLKELD